MKELNNARIVCSENYCAVYDIKCIDKEQHLWRGTILPNMKASKKLEDNEAYFLRREGDSDFPEIHITDESVVGVEFWLIPMDDVLFGYEPPSTILKPQIHLN